MPLFVLITAYAILLFLVLIGLCWVGKLLPVEPENLAEIDSRNYSRYKERLKSAKALPEPSIVDKAGFVFISMTVTLEDIFNPYYFYYTVTTIIIITIDFISNNSNSNNNNNKS